MLMSKCPLCGCTGIHACMGKPLSDGAIYASYGNMELKVMAQEEILKLFEKSVDEDPNKLVS